MTDPQILTALIACLSVLFIGEAMRRGIGRALAAMAVMGAWLGVTLAVLRSFPQWEASSDAVLNYVVVMSAVLLLYFGGRSWLPRRARTASATGSGPPASAPEN
jgi:hypothetical protein